MDSKREITQKAHERLESAKISFEETLLGVNARTVFTSYAIERMLSARDNGANKYMRPATVAIELAAWLLFPHFEKDGVSDGGRIEEVLKSMEAYQSAYTFAEMFPNGSAEFDELDSHLRGHTGMVRGSAYSIQLIDRIKAILGHFEHDFRKDLGVGPLRTLELHFAILRQTEQNINSMRSRFHKLDAEQRRILAEKTDNREIDQVALRKVHHAMQSTADGWHSDWIPTRAQIADQIEGLSDLEWTSFTQMMGLTVQALQSGRSNETWST